LIAGKNVLQLFNIVETRNFTCVAASKLGVIETHSLVKVQGEPRVQIPVLADPGCVSRIRIFFLPDPGSNNDK
jgi:receptor-type tyrosine-protein phosphatase F